MFYPIKLGTSEKDTVGKWYNRARFAANIVMMLSGVIFAFVNHLAGFITLCMATTIHGVLIGRERYIQAIRHIRTIGALRERLLFFGDSEYVFQDLATDYVWRGEEVDPAITEDFILLRRERTEFFNKVDELLKHLTVPEVPVDEGKQN